MVEVKAHILGGAVLLAGDTVQVCITVTAPPLDPAASVQSSEVCEVIGWASAQVHCICMINEALVSLPADSPCSKPAEEDAVTNSSTSFAPWRGEKGHLVLATKPKILFCDLQLMPGQSKSYLYRETLPVDAPPSYRGKLVKYTYKVTVGTQKLGCPISLLRLPLRVIVLQGLAPPVVNSDTEDLAPSNPFLHTPQRDNCRQSTLRHLQSMTSLKNISQYNISHAKGHVVTFTVYKSSYRLGEDITATFDFTKAEVNCVQYSATLQSEEEVSSSCLLKDNQRPVVVPYTKTHEVCLSFTHTNFLLPTPLTVTPTFSTDIVSLRWYIHFEFVLNTGEETQTLPGGTRNARKSDDRTKAETWRAPQKMKIETLVWDLPITICPTSPDQLSQALGFSSSHSQIV